MQLAVVVRVLVVAVDVFVVVELAVAADIGRFSSAREATCRTAVRVAAARDRTAASLSTSTTKFPAARSASAQRTLASVDRVSRVVDAYT